MLSEAMQKLCESLSCVGYRGDRHTHILIEETDIGAKMRSVKLSTDNGDWFSIAPDKGRGIAAQMSPLLSVGREHDHHRACDSVILIRRDKGLQILYVDLKSDDPTGYAGQFKSTRCFIRYALGLLEEFHGETIEIVDERYIIFHSIRGSSSINKTVTSPDHSRLRSSLPEKAFKKPTRDGVTLPLKEFYF